MPSHPVGEGQKFLFPFPLEEEAAREGKRRHAGLSLLFPSPFAGEDEGEGNLA